MIVETLYGDIIDYIKEYDGTRPLAVLHVANCMHIMGGGVASALKNEFPEVFQADLRTTYGAVDKLGTASVAYLTQYPNVTVYNMYAQYDIGRGSYPGNPLGCVNNMPLNYSALYNCLMDVRVSLAPNSILMYPEFGTLRAGGDWRIIEAMIEVTLGHIQGHRKVVYNG